MKKVLLLLIALAMVTGFAAAQESIGLTAGAEFGIENATNDARVPYLMPMVIYENAFLDGAFDLYAELDYTAQFVTQTPMSLYFDLELGYNLKLAEASTLSFLFVNEENVTLAPQDDSKNSFDVTLSPGVQFTQTMDFGGLYAKLSAPLTVVSMDKSAGFAAGLNVTLGWESTFGLGLEITELNTLTPSAGYNGLEILVNYTMDAWIAEIKTEIPAQIDADGITVTPRFDYSFGSLLAYVYCGIGGIGASGGEVSIWPALGVQYSF